jgi:hypothetical protein
MTSNRLCFNLLLAVASIALPLGIAGCNKTATPDNTAQAPAGDQTQTAQSQDPAADANLAPVAAAEPAPASAAAQTQSAQQNYAPPASREPRDSDRYRPSSDSGYSNSGRDYPPDSGGSYSNDDYSYDDQDTSYGQPVVYASQPPPPLPEYSQPECPGDGYLWTPGFWSYAAAGAGVVAVAAAGYYWVPGAWSRPPQPGYLWTPGYWGYTGGRYRYNNGYWGRHIGYYGGVDYGNGYTGAGYQGGYWQGDRFNYNRAVNNVTTTPLPAPVTPGRAALLASRCPPNSSLPANSAFLR